VPRPNKTSEATRQRPSGSRPTGRESARTVVYTDGACSGNPGPGGWAWVIPGGRFRSGADRHTTNQRMELAAALDAVRNIEGPLEIVSDSTYVVNCFRNSWWEGWLRRGWTNSKKQPVANRDLWEPLVEAYRARSITFRWVKGHAGNRWNDLADRLAVEASLSQRGAEGEGPVPQDSVAPSTGKSRSRTLHRPGGAQADYRHFDGTVVYTDGHGKASAGPGGWAWLVPGVRYRSGFEMRSTNPRMELTAALDCLRTVEGEIELVSDSTYLVNCFVNRWWERWLQQGWLNSKGNPVANRDLWEPIIEVFRSDRVNLRMEGQYDGDWPGTARWLASEAVRARRGAEGEVPQPGT